MTDLTSIAEMPREESNPKSEDTDSTSEQANPNPRSYPMRGR